MATYEWDPALETGEPLIDEQHREIFELAGRLETALERHEADPEAVTDAVYALSQYVVEHFSAEETLMAERGYPGLPVHRSLHENLARQTLGIAASFFNGEEILPTTLAPFVVGWLKTHICEEDMDFTASAGADRSCAD